MKAVLVQPPFVQLNAPYPAIHYLEAFLRSRGHEAFSYDHSIELYRAIFSREGLGRVFADARLRLAESPADRELDRYLSYEELYLEWIDPVVDFLGGGDPALAHRLAQAVELPRGMRTAAFLDAEGGRISSDQSRVLATLILEDLGDFITQVLDPEFGTVRYAERIASSRGDFAEIRSALGSSYLLTAFYRPLLRNFWRGDRVAGADVVIITVPFPGCLLGALACAQAARAALGPSALILIGGGYVSTELRGLCDPGIFDYCDYLCFDAGYGCLASILESRAHEGRAPDGGSRSGLYRCMYRLGDGRIAVSGFPAEEAARPVASADGRVALECRGAERYRGMELLALSSTYPDYASADFRSYLGVVDSTNPMHRLWSDAPWLKYHLAYGCYWKRCAFCDTELDYVSGSARCDLDALFQAAAAASASSGLRGIHFVDEAMPMNRLLAFAAANRARAAAGSAPFSFWGNVRFDASWTEGRCEYLSAAGLVAVSGGIEIATEHGLAMTDKGFDLATLVRCLVAMKRSGILVHAYLIYGFPEQDEGELIDSAEVCRQLFAAGLVDSAFWHRFVLTRHSRMYREWKEGRRPRLRPIDEPRPFADNDLSFVGEDRFEPYDAALAASLAAWMAGSELERPAIEWLDEARSRGEAGSSVPPDLVESLIARSEAELDARGIRAEDRVHWIAGLPVLHAPGGAARTSAAELVWAYRGELERLVLPAEAAERLNAALLGLIRSDAGQRFSVFAEAIGSDAPSVVPRLAQAGLVPT